MQLLHQGNQDHRGVQPMRSYLSAIVFCALLLAVDRFELLDLGGFANGVAIMLVVFAILALHAHSRKGKSADRARSKLLLAGERPSKRSHFSLPL